MVDDNDCRIFWHSVVTSTAADDLHRHKIIAWKIYIETYNGDEKVDLLRLGEVEDPLPLVGERCISRVDRMILQNQHSPDRRSFRPSAEYADGVIAKY